MLAEEILMKAGVKRGDLVQTTVIAAHPGGTVRIGELLDKDCQPTVQIRVMLEYAGIVEQYNSFGLFRDRDQNTFTLSWLLN